MPIVEALNLTGTTITIISGIGALLKRFNSITADNLFKRCLEDTVKRNAANLANLTETGDPKTVSVDPKTLDDFVISLKDSDMSILTSAEENDKLQEITYLLQKCIILPGHSLTDEKLAQKILPVLQEGINEFYSQLPQNQQVFNEILLELQREQLKGLKHLGDQDQAILDGIQKLDSKLPNLSSKHIDLIVSDAVDTALATEHQSIINSAKDLLENNKPETAFKQLDDLWQRIGNETSTSEISKFNILTNMAAAQFALNNEQEAAELLLRAFDFNPEDERALSNCALAHLLLGETEKAADYAEQTLKKNRKNTDAYAILVGISTDEELLEEVIAKVPTDLHDTPQIAHAISEIAKQRRNFEEAKKWGEIMVAQKQGDVPDFKAAFATILINQVLEDSLAAGTRQLTVPQKEQLRRAIELLTEAWDSISTELKEYRADWIINRGTAHFHLGETKEATEDLGTALEIEKSNAILIKNRALLAFDCGEKEIAIELLKKIQSASEVPNAPIMLANILLACERYDEAITKLTDFIKTDPSSELKNDANYFLVRIYIAAERFDEAEQILTPMLESSPTNVLNLINAAMISSKTGKRDEAISQLKKACNYVQDSENLHEKLELADQLYIHDQFKEAATLYEKLADTSQNSQLTVGLLASYYNAGEIGKALEICQKLREKYGPLENISDREVIIYEQIGDMNQAESVCKAYLNKFPDDIDMRIRLGMVYYRSRKEDDIDNLLDSIFNSNDITIIRDISLPACVQLTHLHQVRSQPEKALQIMYEARRMYSKDPDAHLKYIGVFFQVEKQIPEVLNPTKVAKDTAVQIDSSDESVSYIIVDRDDADIERREHNTNKPFVQQLLGKTVSEEVNYGETMFGKKIGKIVDIKSKYVDALQESFREFPKLFPEDQGMGSITLNISKETDDPAKFQSLFDVVNQQHEALLRVEHAYKENPLPIGTLANLIDGNVLNAWSHLITKPDLGIWCCTENIEERRNALALLENSQPKLVIDLISLITLHCLEAADTVVKVFGKLCIAQSTIDVLLQIIHEREGMWSQRESMRIEKQGSKYIKHMSNPEDRRHNVERLKDIIKWIRENCEVLPCTPALQMNQLRKRELDEMLQPLFLDTLLIASQPGHLFFSDDGRLRTYAETNFNSDAGTNLQIDGVWTQVVLEHCLNQNVLDKTEYSKMVIQLVCFHYYHTEFDTDTLMDALKQANWNLTEPFNSLIQALGGQKMSLQKALNVSVDFLFKIWEEPIPHSHRIYLTFGLLAGLTAERASKTVLRQLENQIQVRYIIYSPTEDHILRQIKDYSQFYPTIENNFDFLLEDDIKIKGTRIGIETILYDALYLSQTPEEIVENYPTLTLEEVYATILYFLQNPIKIGSYLADNLQFSQILREEYEKNPPPGVVRLRQFKAERQAESDDSHMYNSENDSATTPSPSIKEQE